jgi:protein gp37
MGAETSIAWTDHTFNPWIGCTKVSEGCRNCYAAARDKRWGHDHWGPRALRQVTSASNWREPLRWNKQAQEEGRRHRVFCASLADVFDVEAPEGAREWLWEIIRVTPMLDWQLLTKRPGRVAALLPWVSGAAAKWSRQPWPNVWIGTSVEDQAAADLRIPPLLRVPAAVLFLSGEPLLGPVDLAKHLRCCRDHNRDGDCDRHPRGCPRIHWVIVGGESGAGARPMRLEWAQSLVEQCAAAKVACFVKQMGSRPTFNRFTEGCDTPACNCGGASPRHQLPMKLADSKGGDPAEWPESLRVREFPR